LSLEVAENPFFSLSALTPCLGNSFVGVPTLKEFVAKGHIVEATVRSEAKANQTRAILTLEEASKITFRIIPDVTPDGAFDGLIKTGRYDAVVHIAAPFYYSL
jgi:nucleoside-diphosphate-sugar epimerase